MINVDIDVIIVNYNGKGILKNCVQSLINTAIFQPQKIIVVDNASTDKSLNMLIDVFPDVKLIKNRINLGYSKAVNQGIKASQGEYLLVLNNDIQVTARSIKMMLDTLVERVDIACVGGQLIGTDGVFQKSWFNNPSLLKLAGHMLLLSRIPLLRKIVQKKQITNKLGKTFSVPYVAGACMLIKRKALDEIGLFDENIFFYHEECEWCIRAHKFGWDIVYMGEATVVHEGGASSFGLDSVLEIEYFLSLLYLYRKHYGIIKSWIMRFLVIFGVLIRIFLLLFGIVYPMRPSLWKINLRDTYGLSVAFHIYFKIAISMFFGRRQWKG